MENKIKVIGFLVLKVKILYFRINKKLVYRVITLFVKIININYNDFY